MNEMQRVSLPESRSRSWLNESEPEAPSAELQPSDLPFCRLSTCPKLLLNS